MTSLESIIKEEVELILLERGITLSLSTLMPDFSCPCEPDDLGRSYVLQYILPSPIRGIDGVVVFVNGDNNQYRIETTPIKLTGGGLGTRQHAVYNSIKRKLTDYYRDGLLGAGWGEDCDESLSSFYTPPW